MTLFGIPIRDLITFSLPFALLIIMVAGMIYQRRLERRAWNGGRCERCHCFWRRFDCDSQGGRGYSCRGCSRTLWISYGVDRNYEENVPCH